MNELSFSHVPIKSNTFKSTFFFESVSYRVQGNSAPLTLLGLTSLRRELALRTPHHLLRLSALYVA